MTNEPTKRCPFCGEEILAVAIKCKHCMSDLTGRAPPAAATSNGVTASNTDFGWALLGVPLAGTLLLWFWVANLALIQGPGSATGLIVVGVILATAALAATEAGKLGMKADRTQGSYSPAQWMLMCLLLWIVGYPAYLFKRRHYGRSNLLVWGLLIALVFLGSAAAISAAIEAKNAEVRAQLDKLGDLQKTFTAGPPAAETQPTEASPAPQSERVVLPDAGNDPEYAGARKRIYTYCNKIAHVAQDNPTIKDLCLSREYDAWHRMNRDHEFPSVDLKINQDCEWALLSSGFSSLEDCIRSEIKAKDKGSTSSH